MSAVIAHTDQQGEPTGGFDPSNPVQVGYQRNGIAPPGVIEGEVGPATRRQVYLEGAEVSVISTRVERDVLIPIHLSPRQHPLEQGW